MLIIKSEAAAVRHYTLVVLDDFVNRIVVVAVGDTLFVGVEKEDCLQQKAPSAVDVAAVVWHDQNAVWMVHILGMDKSSALE